MSALRLLLWGILSVLDYFNIDRIGSGQVNSQWSLEVFSVCAVIFILYEERSREFVRLLLYMILVSAYLVCLNSLLGTANHLIISLDILVFFSILIVVRFHNLKVAYNLLQY